MQATLLRVGDQLLVAGFVTHVMTYVGPIGPSGEDVLDAPKRGAARLVHFWDIASTDLVKLGERGPESLTEQRLIQQRALQAVGTVNRPLGPNCEHIDSYVREGEPKSPQLAFGVCLGLALVLFVASR